MFARGYACMHEGTWWHFVVMPVAAHLAELLPQHLLQLLSLLGGTLAAIILRLLG